MRAMKQLIFAVCFLACATVAQAQTAGPASRFNWIEVGQSAAVAQSALYNYYDPPTATTATGPLTGVTCTAGTPATDAACNSSIPAFTLGSHTVAMTQTISGVESAKSNGITFTFTIVVTPSGFRVVPDDDAERIGLLPSAGYLQVADADLR